MTWLTSWDGLSGWQPWWDSLAVVAAFVLWVGLRVYLKATR